MIRPDGTQPTPEGFTGSGAIFGPWVYRSTEMMMFG